MTANVCRQMHNLEEGGLEKHFYWVVGLTFMEETMLGQIQDSVQAEWKQSLKSYPPLLTPRQVQEASLGILRANDIYRRNHRDGKRLELDCRMIGGKIFVTRESLVAVLSGKPDLPL